MYFLLCNKSAKANLNVPHRKHTSHKSTFLKYLTKRAPASMHPNVIREAATKGKITFFSGQDLGSWLPGSCPAMISRAASRGAFTYQNQFNDFIPQKQRLFSENSLLTLVLSIGPGCKHPGQDTEGWSHQVAKEWSPSLNLAMDQKI